MRRPSGWAAELRLDPLEFEPGRLRPVLSKRRSPGCSAGTPGPGRARGTPSRWPSAGRGWRCPGRARRPGGSRRPRRRRTSRKCRFAPPTTCPSTTIRNTAHEPSAHASSDRLDVGQRLGLVDDLVVPEHPVPDVGLVVDLGDVGRVRGRPPCRRRRPRRQLSKQVPSLRERHEPVQDPPQPAQPRPPGDVAGASTRRG